MSINLEFADRRAQKCLVASKVPKSTENRWSDQQSGGRAEHNGTAAFDGRFLTVYAAFVSR